MTTLGRLLAALFWLGVLIFLGAGYLLLSLLAPLERRTHR